MAYIYFNPNPKGQHIGDCTVRALCKALNIPWDMAYMHLCLEGSVMCDMPSSNAVWGNILIKNGFERHGIPDKCPICYTIADFATDNNVGCYVVGTGTHVVTVQNGDYFDTWDSGGETAAFYFERMM